MEKERLDRVIEALNAKGVKLPCPRCNHNKFSAVDETSLMIQNEPGTFSIGGPTIPTVIIICNNCGFVSQHSTKALGI